MYKKKNRFIFKRNINKKLFKMILNFCDNILLKKSFPLVVDCIKMNSLLMNESYKIVK